MTAHANKSTTARSRARILLVEWNEDGTVGGSHRLLFDLASNLDDTRFEPVVLFYQTNRFRAPLEAMGVDVHAYDETRRAERQVRLHGRRLARYVDSVRAIMRRAKLLRELDVDLVHLINSPWHEADLWLPACRATSTPCVATAGGVVPQGLGLVRRLMLRGFDRILAVSEYVAAELRRFGPSSNVQVIHPGVDVRTFRECIHKSRDTVRSELGIAAGKVLVTMVGNIRPWKGQHIVLESLTRLSDDIRRKLHLLLVGATSATDTDYAERIRNAARTPELEPFISLLGERHDVAELFNASDLALHASLKPEPFGLVVVEALAAGTPVIAANRGGPAEILTPECGFLFNSENPGELVTLLERSVCNREKLRAMREAAWTRSEQFTAERMTQDVERVYESLLTSAGRE